MTCQAVPHEQTPHLLLSKRAEQMDGKSSEGHVQVLVLQINILSQGITEAEEILYSFFPS